MGLDEFLTTLVDYNISQIICLVTQLILTIHTVRNLRYNRQQFPVKQLSPLLSLVALISFLALNIINFTGKIIENANGYYNPNFQGQKCGQCRIYQHPEMIVLAFLYNGLRQLPLIIFIIKTYRVCLCYDKKYDQQLSSITTRLFSSQTKLLLLSSFITIIIMVVGYFVFGSGTQYQGNLIFQFFCPKQSGVYDWIINILRFTAMSYVYIISIYTYNELDFKKFLILIFILTNTEVILRLFLALAKISRTTYHQFYYHSFFMNLFGTLIMLYYSSFKQKRNKPLSFSILQNFRGFLQNALGFSVLLLYSQFLDSQNNTRKYQQTYESYIMIDEILLRSSQQQDFRIQNHTEYIIKILQNIQVLKDLPQKQRLVQKCKSNTINIRQLRNIESSLYQFCQRQIFRQWRQTLSSKYLQTQFKNNGVINLRMNALGIQL